MTICNCSNIHHRTHLYTVGIRLLSWNSFFLFSYQGSLQLLQISGISSWHIFEILFYLYVFQLEHPTWLTSSIWYLTLCFQSYLQRSLQIHISKASIHSYSVTLVQSFHCIHKNTEDKRQCLGDLPAAYDIS